MWSEIGVLYRSELRSALRDRTIVINSILIPIVLYPVLLWAMFTALAFVSGKTEGFLSRVAIIGLPERHAGLQERLADSDSIELVADLGGEEATAAIRNGDLDILVEIAPPEQEGAELADNYQVRLSYDASKDRSRSARERVTGLLAEYRQAWLREEASILGISREQWHQFAVDGKNLATQEEVGAFLMGLLLPLILIIMLALGCIHPAIDATAGERERSTWETLLSSSASRTGIVIAKYLYVATMGVVAGFLNLVSMTVSMGIIFAPLLRDAGERYDFSFPFASLPVLAGGTVLLALFVAAGMMILASFARTFKEGQALVTPFLLLLYLPVFAMQGPDIELTVTLACIPVANMMLVFREAINGQFSLPLIGLSFVVEAVTVVLCLRLAAAILQFEDVVIGSYQGNLAALIKQRLLKRKNRRGESA